MPPFAYVLRVNIEYVDRAGNILPVKAKVGDNVMYLAHRYDIELEGNNIKRTTLHWFRLHCSIWK